MTDDVNTADKPEKNQVDALTEPQDESLFDAPPMAEQERMVEAILSTSQSSPNHVFAKNDSFCYKKVVNRARLTRAPSLDALGRVSHTLME